MQSWPGLRNNPPRLVACRACKRGPLASQPHSAAHDGAQRAMFERSNDGASEASVGRGQQKGIAKGFALPRIVGVHVQPAGDAGGFDCFRRQPYAIAIENVNCAPHAETVRVYSMRMSRKNWRSMSSYICSQDPRSWPSQRRSFRRSFQKISVSARGEYCFPG